MKASSLHKMSSNLINDFCGNLIKSLYSYQYECIGCNKRRWGNLNHDSCKNCKNKVKILPFIEMIGIGWFVCKCRRIYAGFSRGNVTSKCHGCQKENLPYFIVEGDDPKGYEETKNFHYCSKCKGSNKCPIVAQARRTR